MPLRYGTISLKSVLAKCLVREIVPCGSPYSDQVNYLICKFCPFTNSKRMSTPIYIIIKTKQRKELSRSQKLISVKFQKRWSISPSEEHRHHHRFLRLHAPAYAFPPPFQALCALNWPPLPSKSRCIQTPFCTSATSQLIRSKLDTLSCETNSTPGYTAASTRDRKYWRWWIDHLLHVQCAR